MIVTAHANIQSGFDHGILLKEGKNGYVKVESSAGSPFGLLENKHLVAINNIPLHNMDVAQIDSILKSQSGDVVLQLVGERGTADVEDHTDAVSEQTTESVAVDDSASDLTKQVAFFVSAIGSIVAFIISLGFAIVTSVATHRTFSKQDEDDYNYQDDFSRIRFSFPSGTVFFLISMVCAYAAGKFAKKIKPAYSHKTSTVMISAWTIYCYCFLLAMLTFKYHLDGYTIPEEVVHASFGLHVLSWLSMVAYVVSVWFSERFH